MAAPLDFYFDYASPYGYLASTRIDDLAARHGRTATWRPILLGAIFKITGMKPNLHQPLRGEYLKHDAARFARLLKVPFTSPESSPMNGLAATRAYWWLFDSDPAMARRLAQAVYRAHFVDGRDMSPPEAVVEVAAGLGLDSKAVEAALQDAAVKDRVRAENDAAVARGVYGSPFVLVDGEPFWGADRLDQVDRWLATGGW